MLDWFFVGDWRGWRGERGRLGKGGGGGGIKNFFLLCGLAFLVLYNLKLSGSPVSYVPFRPSPNLASIIM